MPWNGRCSYWLSIVYWLDIHILWSELPTGSHPPCDVSTMVPIPIAWIEFSVDVALGNCCHNFVFAKRLGLDILCNNFWRCSCFLFWLCWFDPHSLGAQAHDRQDSRRHSDGEWLRLCLWSRWCISKQVCLTTAPNVIPVSGKTILEFRISSLNSGVIMSALWNLRFMHFGLPKGQT